MFSPPALLDAQALSTGPRRAKDPSATRSASRCARKSARATCRESRPRQGSLFCCNGNQLGNEGGSGCEQDHASVRRGFERTLGGQRTEFLLGQAPPCSRRHERARLIVSDPRWWQSGCRNNFGSREPGPQRLQRQICRPNRDANF